MSTGRTVLVTGGAGYVGAHVCLALAEAGWLPVAYDDLSGSHRAAVRWGPLEEGDIRNATRLTEAFARHRPAAVLHLAALVDVAASHGDPARWRDVNVGGSRTVIDAARAAGVTRFVFASSCAVYGMPERLPLDPAHPVRPVSPYGAGKRAVEEMLRAETGLRSVTLRCYNAAGADPLGRIGEARRCETHALPRALAATGAVPFAIHGMDHPTRDGTAERDYVHVADLADAHVRALDHLARGGPGGIVDLATGRGTTVGELLAAVGRETGAPVPRRIADPRPGDPPALVGSPASAAALLGWHPLRAVDDMVRDAARWHRGGMAAAMKSR